jgi:S-adenosyl-L-methionine hydrolase (adenosine-forming)
MPRVTLLTDFGTGDGYVAAMKGVITQIAPSVIIDDASHDIEPGDVHAAAWALAGYWHLFPVGTVHVVVVDPGVGSERRSLAVECDGRYLVGPDNGVFTRALAAAEVWRAVAIENRSFMRDVISSTFHGRDIFAPAAAHIASGTPLESLGAAVTDPVLLEIPAPVQDGGAIDGAIVHVDRFGNLVTNVPQALAAAVAVVHIGGRSLPLQRTYADVERGELLALVGSHGHIEVALRDGSAAELLQVRPGHAVRVTLE